MPVTIDTIYPHIRKSLARQQMQRQKADISQGELPFVQETNVGRLACATYFIN